MQTRRYPHQIPTEPRQRAQWIISELKLSGTSLAAIANELGCSRQAGALALRVASRRWEEALAAKLKVPVEQLWPDRYSPDGTRLLRSRDAPSRAAA
jgi:Ner family transcriptional regulator